MDLTHNYTAPRGTRALAKEAAQMLAFLRLYKTNLPEFEKLGWSEVCLATWLRRFPPENEAGLRLKDCTW